MAVVNTSDRPNSVRICCIIGCFWWRLCLSLDFIFLFYIGFCHRTELNLFLLSASEPKAEVHYCDHTLSVVRPSVRPSSVVVNFSLSSETTEWNLTKLDRKQDLNVLFQVCAFRGDRKKQDGRHGL